MASGYYVSINNERKGFRVLTHGTLPEYSVSLWTIDYQHAKAEARKIAGKLGLHIHDHTASNIIIRDCTNEEGDMWNWQN
jgi:hypothetical protein